MKKQLLALALIISSAAIIHAQEIKYRRSSLSVVLLESESFPNKEIVIDAYNKKPFPDKYNMHSVGVKSFNPKKYVISDAERAAAGQSTSNLSKFGKGLASSATDGAIDIDAKDIPLQIEKFIKETKLAKQIVAKWYNRQADGKMDYQLVKERGLYSASASDKEIASSTSDSNDYLFDEDLVGNTFVVFNKLTFLPNEPIARAVRDLAMLKASEIQMEMAKNKAIEGLNIVYEKTKEGYSVWTTSYLYKLVWNKDVVENFKNKFITKPGFGKESWDTTSIFKLELLGDEKSVALVTFSLKVKRTEQQIIELAVSRNIDNVYAKLQKKYVVFRPVTPISSIDPLTAKIGLKEGLEPGDSFDILESVRDTKTGTYKYVSVGSASVDKKLPIYDNRFGAAEGPQVDSLGKAIILPQFTTFTGGKKAVVGMNFIRLKK